MKKTAVEVTNAASAPFKDVADEVGAQVSTGLSAPAAAAAGGRAPKAQGPISALANQQIDSPAKQIAVGALMMLGGGTTAGVGYLGLVRCAAAMRNFFHLVECGFGPALMTLLGAGTAAGGAQLTWNGLR